MARTAALAAMCVVFAVAVAMVDGASALPAECNVGKLVVCAPAVIMGATPAEACCTNLKAQQGCFCAYAGDPAYRGYVNSPTARKTMSSCGITLPSCATAEAVAPAVSVLSPVLSLSLTALVFVV